MTGKVSSSLGAMIRLRVRNPLGVEFEVEAMIDTGFDHFLTLPVHLVTKMGLTKHITTPLTLADGSLRSFDSFRAEVFWDGGWRPIIVLVLGDEVLVGTELLRGSRLAIDWIDGGLVEITPIP